MKTMVQTAQPSMVRHERGSMVPHELEICHNMHSRALDGKGSGPDSGNETSIGGMGYALNRY